MKQLFLLLTLSVFVFSCNLPDRKDTPDEAIQKKTDIAMEEANRQVGMPAIVNYQEKKLMKQIYELRDRENFICYAYIVDMMGRFHFIGKCVGYGLPYSTQFSNPERLVDVTDFNISSYQANDAANLPQPEPNGLFMPEGLSATWLLMIDPETQEARPVYIESEIFVSPFEMNIKTLNK